MIPALIRSNLNFDLISLKKDNPNNIKVAIVSMLNHLYGDSTPNE